MIGDPPLCKEAQDFLSEFLRVYHADETAYLVTDYRENVFAAFTSWETEVCWNIHSEFGEGHWVKLVVNRRCGFWDSRTEPAKWQVQVWDRGVGHTISTDPKAGHPILRDKFLAETLQRYRR